MTSTLMKKRLLWVTVVLALIFMLTTHINSMYGWLWPRARQIISYFLDPIQFPAYLIGVLVSGKSEAPNPIAFYITWFITYITVFGTLIVGCRFLYRQTAGKVRK